MTNYGFCSDAENDEQVEDQAASESQLRQRWVVAQLFFIGNFFSFIIQAPRVLDRLNPRSSLLYVGPHGPQARHLESRSSTLYI